MIALETVDLELQLAALFSRLLDTRYVVAVATYLTPKSDQARLDVLRNAAHAALDPMPGEKPETRSWRRKTDALNRILNIINRAQTAINNRHRVMHDAWQASGEDRIVKRLVIDGRTGRAAVPIQLSDLRQQIEVLRRLIDDVIDLTNEFDANPPAVADLRPSSPDTSE